MMGEILDMERIRRGKEILDRAFRDPTLDPERTREWWEECQDQGGIVVDRRKNMGMRDDSTPVRVENEILARAESMVPYVQELEEYKGIVTVSKTMVANLAIRRGLKALVKELEEKGLLEAEEGRSGGYKDIAIKE